MKKTQIIFAALLTLVGRAQAQTPIVSIPSNYNLAFNYTPSSLSQIAPTIGGSAILSTVAGNGWQEGYATFVNNNSNLSIVTKGGITALQMATSATSGSIISTMDHQGHGFAQALGYWECQLWCPPCPSGGTGLWGGYWMLGVSSSGALPGYTGGPFFGWNPGLFYGENGYPMQSDIDQFASGGSSYVASSTINSSPASGSLQDGWHIYSELITATGTKIYIDGVQVVSFAAPGQSGATSGWNSNAAWNEPAFGMIFNGTGPASWNAIAKLTFPENLWVGYLRCWGPGATPIPTPTPGPLAPGGVKNHLKIKHNVRVKTLIDQGGYPGQWANHFISP